MKRLLSILLSLHFFFSASGQLIETVVPIPLSQIDKKRMPYVDNEALVQVEMSLRGPERAPRFAKSIEVDLTPSNSGTWVSTSEGIMIWRLHIESENAHSLNFGFSEFRLPKDASLILYSPESMHWVGPFTKQDNEDHNQLWSPIIEGSNVVLQLSVPEKSMDKVGLRLSYVNHDFVGFRSVLSGACNVDVVCGEEDGSQFSIIDDYRDIIQSVGLATFNGNAFCTGFLVNNTRQDQTPYYMTAHHCGVSAGNAGSLVVYWNFENSTCRPPGSGQSGSQGDGHFDHFNSGAFFRSTWSQSDFTLTELDDPVVEEAEAYFAGWDRSDILPGDTVIAVHHPSLDEKRISFEYGQVHRGFWGNGGANIPSGDHIIVPDWDMGTTEGGSSGSPLFNKTKKVIGQLHGGQAACSNNSYDSYGWFNFSWEGGGNPTSRLKDWLDPDDTGIVILGGLGESIILPVDPSEQKLCMPESVSYDVTIPQLFTMPVHLSAENLPDGSSIEFSDNPVIPGNVVNVTISNLLGLEATSYTPVLKANDGIDSTTADLRFIVVSELTLFPSLTFPGNLSEDVNINPKFNWSILGSTDISHQIQVAIDPDFENVVIDVSGLINTEYKGDPLQNEKTYYWRVRSENLCGPGPWSTTFAFVTGNTTCFVENSDDTPIAISSAGTPTVNSIKTVNQEGNIIEFVSLSVDITHSFIGDLVLTLTSPSGTELVIFDRPGFPGSEYGCDGSNISIILSDSAPNTATDLEETCSTNDPSIAGTFQPMTPFSSLVGETVQGDWLLRIRDFEDQDGGQLVNWNIEHCSGFSDALAINTDPIGLYICDNVETSFQLTLGNGYESEGAQLSVDDLPEGVEIDFGTNPLLPGQSTSVTVNAPVLADTIFYYNISANDGVNSRSIEMEVEFASSPSEIKLLGPLTGETNLSINPSFIWEMNDNIGNYIIEIAKDEGFVDLAFSIALISSPYELLDIDLEHNTEYFWRITAINQCGQRFSPTHQFVTTESSSVTEIFENQIEIYPNPTNSTLIIDLSDSTLPYNSLDIFSFTGQKVLTKRIETGSRPVILELDDLHEGSYFIRFNSDNFVVNRKFVILR